MSRLADCTVKPKAGVLQRDIQSRRWFIAAISLLLAGLALTIYSSVSARAQDAAAAAPPPAETQTSTVATVQLNKIEDAKDGCDFYFVVSNKTSKVMKTLTVDLILFRTDGVIAKRLYANFAPLRAESKRQVKSFGLKGVKCSEVGSLLANDLLECRDEDGVVNGCFSRLEFSHLGNVSLSK